MADGLVRGTPTYTVHLTPETTVLFPSCDLPHSTAEGSSFSHTRLFGQV